jgi:hypothetical protein
MGAERSLDSPVTVNVPVLDPERMLAVTLRDGRRSSAGERELNFARSVRDGRASAEVRFRAAPLLRVSDDASEGKSIIVGVACVVANAADDIRLEIFVDGRWTLDSAGVWIEDHDALDETWLSALALAEPRHGWSESTDRRTTLLAKGIAEGSRNAVKQLRSLRYELEEQLATVLRDSRAQPPVLASVIELNRACGRALDAAREARREELWLWIDHDRAYQWHRRVLDTTLLPMTAPWTDAPDWYSTHDAGVRQVIRMEEELVAEVTTLYGLLDGASTISVAREAAAQETFNLLAAVAAIGLGLPALVLTLYGADAYLPLRKPSQFSLLIPVFGASMLAVVVAAAVGRQRARPISPVVLALGLIVFVALTLIVAGLIAPTVAPK